MKSVRNRIKNIINEELYKKLSTIFLKWFYYFNTLYENKLSYNCGEIGKYIFKSVELNNHN